MNEGCPKKIRPGYNQYRCGRKIKEKGYCGIHSPSAVARRKEKRDARYKKELKKWDKLAFNTRAGNRCRELGIQPEDICPPK